jgi:hypothetical protein
MEQEFHMNLCCKYLLFRINLDKLQALFKTLTENRYETTKDNKINH